MQIRSFNLWLPVAVAALTSGGAPAQPYPSRPVRIVTSEAGGSADFGARIIAQGLTSGLGQAVITENRPSGVTPADTVIKASPDGHTLLLYSNGLWTLPLIQSVPYDPLRDLAPITTTTTAPNVLVVHPSVAANTVRQLIELARAKPGALNYASTSAGAANHLAGELFKSMAGVNIVRIPYKGTGHLLNAILAGEVQLTFTSGGSIAPHLKTGKLRGLAVASARPSELVPGLPTIADSGLPGYESMVITGIFAPAKTPAAVISRLNREIVQFLSVPDIRERLLRSGVETVGSSPAELAATIKTEISRMGKVIKEAGIRAD